MFVQLFLFIYLLVCFLFHIQIDVAVVNQMADEDLARYLPKVGDRVALKAFAKIDEAEKRTTSYHSPEKKHKLLDRIKERFQGKGKASVHYQGREKHVGNENAKKSTRRVGIGWLGFCFETLQFKQVRGPSGGGTRNVVFTVDGIMIDVLDKAKGLFFPEGTSRRGDVDDYECFVTDNTHKPLNTELTVAEMYSHMKARVLHLYLATMKHDDEDPTETDQSHSEETADQDLPQMRPIRKKKRGKTSCRKKYRPLRLPLLG